MKQEYSYMRYPSPKLSEMILPVQPISLGEANSMHILHGTLSIFSVEAKDTLLLPYRQCEIGALELPRPVHNATHQ
jgi:hypothetical protein